MDKPIDPMIENVVQFALDDPRRYKHGVYYVSRDGTTLYRLDIIDEMHHHRDRVVNIPRPERDVLLGLLAWVRDELEKRTLNDIAAQDMAGNRVTW